MGAQGILRDITTVDKYQKAIEGRKTKIREHYCQYESWFN